ncbi:MAG TPA: hypothetical protein VH988_27240 [Thermoanaerobaculia bacterium]|jgi:hypothetical protein|nr:hypothetical protein [Thermoanaerobaculia bacterium]
MFRSHVTRATAILLLTLALGAVAVPAQAAGFSPESSSRWEQLAEVFFGWILKTTGCIDPNGGGGLCSAFSTGLPFGKAGTAALCLDTSSCINPDGRN